MATGLGRLEAVTAQALAGYKGLVAVMSFNPHSIAHLARLAPDIPRGLTTAASIWCSSAIGIMVGLGMYLAAIGLAALAAGIMVYLSKLESVLPSRHAVAITLRFKEGFLPREEGLRRMALERGYSIAGGSLIIASEQGAQEWRFVALALSKHSGAPLSELAQELAAHESIASFKLAHARN